HIVVLNVPAILSQMQSDAVRARQLRGQSRVHRVGEPSATRLAKRRYVIDVDAERDRANGHLRFSAIDLATVLVLNSRPSRHSVSAALSKRRASSSTRGSASSSAAR